MTEQRRLAAIVSADVAGYSRLMGQDESGTLAALKALRQEVVDPAIANHGGRIVKTTGDGLLLEFPSVVNAVRCAVEVQAAMADRSAEIAEDQRIAFRVGINIGDIIVDGDDIFGDGVNVAARLQEIAPPGGICISSRVHEDVRDRLDTAFDDGGAQTLKNIARPVQVWRWQPGTAVVPKPAPPPTVLLLPDKPSIAVLPFQNMSGDSQQEYFVDGLVEEIITALSKFKSLFVIARTSSFTYKGKAVDIKQVARELGVRYVLEGSIRKAANRVRITGQLIESETSTHLWADRFEGALEDVFLLQDVVAEKVVAALAPSVEQAEIERAKRKPTANLGAYDCYLRGLAVHEVLSRENVDAAAGLFQRALELDPEFSPALGLLLSCYANRRGFGILADAESEKTEVARLVSRALRIGRDDAVALGPTALAIAYFLRDLTFANEQVSRALTLNPNLASAWGNSGWINLWSGDPATAIEHLSRALRHDPLRVFGGWRSGLSHAHFFLDRYQEALHWAEGFLRADPDAHAGLRIATASAAFAGMTDEARNFARHLIEVDPAFRVSCLEDYLGPYRPREFVEKYKLGLRLAGLPE